MLEQKGENNNKSRFPCGWIYRIQTSSQQPDYCGKTNNYVVFELNLITNYEFETQLLGYLNECIIVKPEKLRQKLIERAEKIVSKNK